MLLGQYRSNTDMGERGFNAEGAEKVIALLVGTPREKHGSEDPPLRGARFVVPPGGGENPRAGVEPKSAGVKPALHEDARQVGVAVLVIFLFFLGLDQEVADGVAD